MHTYIGTKIVNAEPWEKGGQAGYRIAYPDGYISWSPKAVFEEAYRLVNDGERAMLDPRRTGPARTETFYDRLLAESRELEARKDKLKEFLDGFNFLELPADQQQLLRDQFVCMDSYAQILGQRIAALNSGTQGQARPAERIDDNVRVTGGGKSETPIPFRE